MPANAVVRSIALGSPDWTKLADTPTVVQATLIADPKNAGTINLRFREGTAADWPPAAAVPLESVDLSELEVKGNAGHALLVAAYAPGSDPRGRASRASLRALLMLPAGPADPVDPGETGGEIG